MSVETQKLELIEWILEQDDVTALEKIIQLKKNTASRQKKTRKFGSGKHIFTYVADDFDAPLDDFKEYMK